MNLRKRQRYALKVDMGKACPFLADVAEAADLAIDERSFRQHQKIAVADSDAATQTIVIDLGKPGEDASQGRCFHDVDHVRLRGDDGIGN